MECAWSIRRSSFDKPDDEQRRLLGEARDDLERAVSLCREGPDPVELAQAIHLQANVERDLGRNDEALTLWQEAVVILRETDRPLELAHKVRHLGDLYQHTKRFHDADVCYEEAAALYRRHEKPGSLNYPNAIRPMALLKERMGDVEQALKLWRETRELYASVRIEGLDTQPALDECDQRIARLVSKA